MEQLLAGEAVISNWDIGIQKKVELIRKRQEVASLSTVALQGRLHGTKKYTQNPNNVYINLTELVLQYKQESSSQILQEILKLTEKLILKVMRSYNMFNFPESVTEDVIADCNTLVLLKCLKTFDPMKKAAFATHYTWWLKSYMNYKRDFHNRRKPLYDTGSLHPDQESWDCRMGAVPEMQQSTFTSTTMSRVKRLVAENFK